MNIRDYVKSNRLLADGAFGTYYAQLTDRQSISELANIEDQEMVKKIHLDYINAGARLIRTNTFGASREILGCGADIQQKILENGFRLANNAAAESGETVFIAADIGPIPESFCEEEEILEEYRFICDTFLAAGAEIILFETFPDMKYVEILAEYIKAKRDVTVLAQFCLDRYGYTRSGIKAGRLFEKAAGLPALDGFGFNCGIGAGHMLQILSQMNLDTEKLLLSMPNSSYPEFFKDRAVYLDNSQYFAKRLLDIAKLGVPVLGGCCGTTPDYIREAGKLLSELPFQQAAHKKRAASKPLKEGTPNEFMEKLRTGRKVVAVELDPPYDAKFGRILECAHQLKALGVDMLTFADSPMARGRMDSVLSGVKVRSEVDIPVMPHITCRDRNMIAMRAQLLGAYANQVRNLLLVTGDPIPGSDRGQATGVFDFNSVRLMEFVREMNEEHFKEEPFYYGGALNYARANLEAEIARMKKKIGAGAGYFLTQPVFSDEDIERIAYIKKKVDTRILCGIMPLVSYRNASFIQNEITGIHVPDWVVEAFSPDMTRQEGEETGVRIARDLIRKLSDIGDGYYFMLPFNRVHLVDMCLRK